MILRATGGIPIDRSNAVSVVSVLAARAAEDESFVIVLAAEGTRSHGEHWKSGFHRLARQTGLPVSFGYIDGPSKTVGMGPTLEMTDDIRVALVGHDRTAGGVLRRQRDEEIGRAAWRERVCQDV